MTTQTGNAERRTGTVTPIRVTLEGIDFLPEGSTVRVEVIVEIGPSSTVTNTTTNMTVNQGATADAEIDVVSDFNALKAVSP